MVVDALVCGDDSEQRCRVANGHLERGRKDSELGDAGCGHGLRRTEPRAPDATDEEGGNYGNPISHFVNALQKRTTRSTSSDLQVARSASRRQRRAAQTEVVVCTFHWFAGVATSGADIHSAISRVTV